jgi:hypothetical protein
MTAISCRLVRRLDFIHVNNPSTAEPPTKRSLPVKFAYLDRWAAGT